jgi:hypothetical protein
MRYLLLATLLAPMLVCAADSDPDLLAASRKGQTDRVRTLLDKGANVESKDKDERTPLMLAARNGHAETVALLLERGAKPDVRDRQGWTAYGLAFFSSASGRDAVLKSLPHPPLPRLTLEVTWAPDHLYNSCFLPPPQLAQQIAGLQLDIATATELRDFAVKNGRSVLELVADGGNGALHLKVRPEVSCVTQRSVDNLSLAIDVRLVRGGAQAAILEKTFGGGLKGLHAREVTSPAQYGSLFADWVKSHAGQIYWAALEAWLRTP